jgi:hypothetical protein
MVHMFGTQLILCNKVHLSIFLTHCLEIFVIKLLLSAKILISQAALQCLTITACTSFLAYTIPAFRYRICGCHTGVGEGSSDE